MGPTPRPSSLAVPCPRRRVVDDGEDVAITEPVVLEVLAGSRSARQTERLGGALLAFPLITVCGLDDYVRAASIYRACRAAGEEVRGTLDRLIAAVAIRHDASVLHHDRDFETIARHTDLRIERIT
jgi:predicted nucleic acid-binding protein